MLQTLSAPFLAMTLGLMMAPTLTAQAQTSMISSNAIQPETTISISAEGKVVAEPDVAWLTGGVISEAKTAQEALRQNARDMDGVYRALAEAGLERKHIQTSNFSINPQYSYSKSGLSSSSGKRVLEGYTVSNTVIAKVTDLDGVGPLIDAMVSLGGNSFNGVSFGLQDASNVENEARRKAMRAAMERAKLYADVAGYKIKRIVTINEGGVYNQGPRPEMMARASVAMDAAPPTQISGGELVYSASVTVVFELED